MRPIVILLGVGLFILGLVGVQAVPWLGWIDAVLGILAIIGGSIGARAGSAAWVGGPAALGAGCLALWIIALAVGASVSLAWWTFAFGVAFLLTAAAKPSARVGGPPTTPL